MQNPQKDSAEIHTTDGFHLVPRYYQMYSPLAGQRFVSGKRDENSARLAQSVERWTLNPTVVGSSPTLGEFFTPL